MAKNSYKCWGAIAVKQKHIGRQSSEFKIRNFVKLIKCKMKYFVVAIIAFAVAASWPARVVADYQIPMQQVESLAPPNTNPNAGLGDLMKSLISEYVNGFVNRLLNLIHDLRPQPIPIPVSSAIKKLRGITDPTLGNIEIAKLSIVGLDARDAVAKAPIGITRIHFDIESVVQYFLSKIPKNAKFVKFEDFNRIVGAYIIEHLTNAIIDALNKADLHI